MEDQILAALRPYQIEDRAALHAKFFQAFPGGYGEGDFFLAIKVPNQRLVAKQFKDMPLAEVTQLFASKWHEVRLVAIFILVSQYKKNNEEVLAAYLSVLDRVNNWDLVDSSSRYILGEYLLDKADRSILYELAKRDLWRQRVAVVATHALIVKHDFLDILKLAKLLLHHPHDLMHKAIGWMLREMGDRDRQPLRDFLDEHAHEMPRTMLRYSIEHFPEIERKMYLNKKSR